MTVIVSRKAQQDLDQAYRHIAQDSPESADRLLVRILHVIDILASGELVGRNVRLRDGRQVQTWPIPPYRIYYRKSAESFNLLRVYHQARRPIE